MASSTHQFGVLDLIRAGLQDLDTARTLLDELRADGIDDDRLCLLMKTLEQTCEPDIALRNLVDIIKALQSQGRDFHQVITDDAGLVRLRHRARRVRRNGQAHALPPRTRHGRSQRLMRKPPVQPRAAARACARSGRCRPGRQPHAKSHRNPLRRRRPRLRQTYRKQLAAIMAQDTTADDPNRNPAENQPGTVRSCRRGPGRRARHRPRRSGRQRTRALRHHRHGQARRDANSTTYPTWTSSTWWNRRTRTPTA